MIGWCSSSGGVKGKEMAVAAAKGYGAEPRIQLVCTCAKRQ